MSWTYQECVHIKPWECDEYRAKGWEVTPFEGFRRVYGALACREIHVSTKFAPVAPLPILQQLRDEGLLGDYHLLLAHDVAANTDDYWQIFSGMDAHIVLDNSTVELGRPVSINKMLTAKRAVSASVVVLPDYMRQCDRTIKASIGAHSEWDAIGLGPFMVVPQGQSEYEMIKCANALKELPGVVAWGVPKCSAEVLGSRLGLVEQLHRLDKHMDIHLLGFTHDLADDIACARHEGVMGIDSAVPIRLGLYGTRMTQETKAHTPRGDYWNTATQLNDLARENVSNIRAWIQ